MPLNFINKERTRTITICDDVDVVIMGLSAMQKEDLLVEIMQNEAKPGCWRNLSTIVSKVIVEVKGYDKPVMELLKKLDFDQLKKVIDGVIEHCGLTTDERGNSSSSPERPIPGSAGDAERNAEPDGAPASSTRTETAK